MQSITNKNHSMPITCLAAAMTLFSCTSIAQSTQDTPDVTLRGRAVLPAATFAKGPTSGTRLGAGPINGATLPFVDKQPVQGFSAVLDNKDGSFWAMSDNGFGSMENSADYNLRVYRIRPDFKTKSGGTGTVKVEGFFELRDPDKKISWTISRHFSKERVLTGADFDLESFQRAPDGSFWFGDEFGPFLIHTDASGKVLEAPIPLPDFERRGRELRAPQNPLSEEGAAVRIMNAMNHRGRSFGSKKNPVFSCWELMLKDGNPATNVASRMTPPAGLRRAASEVHDVRSMQRSGYPVVPYTINDKARMLELMKLGVDGIISDRPDLLLEACREFDANGDGTGGDYMTQFGTIDASKFDAQGHRGARNLRPENTLPAMEAALDQLMTTLELDCGVTKDGVAVLGHDPEISSTKARRRDGKKYDASNEVLIKDLDFAEIQSSFVADKLFRGAAQRNDFHLSPVSWLYAWIKGLPHPYVIPSLDQVYEFVEIYKWFYLIGPGSICENGVRRGFNAFFVRFNIETKLNPRAEFSGRTLPVERFTDAILAPIQKWRAKERSDIQSFDFRSLLRVQEKEPTIRIVCLFGDFPKTNAGGDGTNLQDENGKNTPWLAGMVWPYRETALSTPFRARASGGFEGMALTSDGRYLLPLLEKPLADSSARELLIHEFDLQYKRYGSTYYRYPLHKRGEAIGDFIMFNKTRGLVIERDGSQGDLNGFKAIYEITLNGSGKLVSKRHAVDLLAIQDPDLISLPASNGDVGLGKRFAFPFVTIEDVVFFGANRIGVLNDNNYPFSIGRHVGSKRPDDNEFIILELGTQLGK